MLVTLLTEKPNCTKLSLKAQIYNLKDRFRMFRGLILKSPWHELLLPLREILGATSGGSVSDNGGGVNIGRSSACGTAIPSPNPPRPARNEF